MEKRAQREPDAQPMTMEAAMQQLLIDNNRGECMEATFGLPRLPEECAPSEPSPKPLWLTAAEAELLVYLCFAAPSGAVPLETELFAKLGRFVRSFSL